MTPDLALSGEGPFAGNHFTAPRQSKISVRVGFVALTCSGAVLKR
jgi:hypothetical protein